MLGTTFLMFSLSDNVVGFVSLILAIITNALLTGMIYSKSSKIVGAYRYIMVLFGIFNILYTLVVFVAHPKVIVIKSSYMAYSGTFTGDGKSTGYFLLSVFIAMYGLSTFILAIHFVYRYIIICRPNQQHLFSSLRWRIAWIVAIIAWGLVYFLITYLAFAPNQRFYNFARASVLSRTNHDINELGFFCVFLYESIGDEHIVYICYCAGLIVMMIMMVFTFAVMIYCGIQTIRKLDRIALSDKTRKLQHQLLRALIAQACIPFIFSYLPRFLIFSMVIKGSSDNISYSWVPYLISLYTFLDPIVFIIFIPNFRQRLFCMLPNVKRNGSIFTTTREMRQRN